MILPEGNKAEASTDSIRVLGSTNRLAELINCEHLDRIIVVPDRLPERELADCVRTSRRMGVVMSHVIAAEPDSRIEFSAFSGLQLLDLRPVYFTRKQEMAKLIFDWIAASIAVLLLSPVLVVLAILVRFTSPGPLLVPVLAGR